MYLLKNCSMNTFQSASLVGGTTRYSKIRFLSNPISIRVPRGRDDIVYRGGKPYRVISIRVPRGRDDKPDCPYLFHAGYFNPRPSWEGRQEYEVGCKILLGISIRVPRGRDDPAQSRCLRALVSFQSASLVGGTTTGQADIFRLRDDFNPRPSWEGRPGSVMEVSPVQPRFQSASLVGGTTFCRIALPSGVRYFNPRPSWEGRPRAGGVYRNYGEISIRVPRGRDDRLGRLHGRSF